LLNCIVIVWLGNGVNLLRCFRKSTAQLTGAGQNLVPLFYGLSLFPPDFMVSKEGSLNQGNFL